MVSPRTLFRMGGGAVVAGLALIGLLAVVRDGRFILRRAAGFRSALPRLARSTPVSILPGPPREDGPPRFELEASNASRMVGRNDPENERWADVAGNFYGEAFVSGFRYDAADADAPRVLLRVDTSDGVLAGRIEARGLKPNFAYQLKLVGDFARDPEGAEIIGYLGRWRLPDSRETNFSDRDFETFPDRHRVDAYILFDFLVTDANGDAARAFVLDSSLHVLWNALRQRDHGVPDEHLVAYDIDAGNPATYARPKAEPTTEFLWAEREYPRYRRYGEQTQIRLPARTYRATLTLTEESFHSSDRDGGWWATVFTLPVAFDIE